jgi:hypothetical protein
VDFTAHTLEWGEIKIGLATISFGLLPRTQISTTPLLYSLGIINGRLKVNFLRAGPVDLGVVANGYSLPLGDFQAGYIGIGPVISVRAADAFSVHLSGLFHDGRAGGVPTQLPKVFTLLPGGEELDNWVTSASARVDEGFSAPQFTGQALDISLTTDYRFNRRDSIILQLQSLVWTKTNFDSESELGLIPLLGLDQILGEKTRVFASYTITLSWQFAWKQLDWRIGGGTSSIPIAWALQGNDVSYRMWGKTRLTDTRRKQGWRKNRRDVKRKPSRRSSAAEEKPAADPELSWISPRPAQDLRWKGDTAPSEES